MTELIERRTENTKIFAGEWNEETYSRELTIREYSVVIHIKNDETGFYDEVENFEELNIAENYADSTVTEHMAREVEV